MAIKQSLEENKDFILDNLPTQELKDGFLADLEKVEEPEAPSVEAQVAEAQAPDQISEDMYDAAKKEIEAMPTITPMSSDEEKAAIEASLKEVNTDANELPEEPEGGSEPPIDENAEGGEEPPFDENAIKSAAE